MREYDEAIRLDPNNAQTYVGRGLTYDQYGNLDKTISNYSEAIRLDRTAKRANMPKRSAILPRRSGSIPLMRRQASSERTWRVIRYTQRAWLSGRVGPKFLVCPVHFSRSGTADLNDENLKREAARLNTAHTGTVLGVRCDVTKEEDVQGMIREAVKFGGRIDILFNNADAGFAGSFDKQTNQDWEKAFAR
jgi:tetratricopeptide (TPR) repeat protein